jgi:hypothetical protein
MAFNLLVVIFIPFESKHAGESNLVANLTSTKVLSIEMAVFVLTLIPILFVRKYGYSSVSPVEGLFTYVTPTQEDFEVL